MTRILIGRDYIEISGHSPDPVVCHGVSAIAQMAANYVTKHQWGNVRIVEGFLKISEICQEHQGDALFAAMSDVLYDIREEYPGTLEIKYENDGA